MINSRNLIYTNILDLTFMSVTRAMRARLTGAGFMKSATYKTRF